MRLLALLATLALAACVSSGLALSPVQCARIHVENRNYNQVAIYLLDYSQARIGEVEGNSTRTLRVCRRAIGDFLIQGFANSFSIRLSSGQELPTDATTTITVGATPDQSYIGQAP